MIAAALAATEARLDYVAIEQDSLGGAVAHYPRGKLVMTAPAMLPIVGKMRFREVQKETLIDFFVEAEKKSGIVIN